MATDEKTLDQLQYLETLYRRGYRSEMVGQSVDKIIALERAAAQRELEELKQRLQAFEARYQMASEDFYRSFRAGELGDSADFVEWSVFWEMTESVRERLEILDTGAA
jgi:cell division septum initiation protein DivIVA